MYNGLLNMIIIKNINGDIVYFHFLLCNNLINNLIHQYLKNIQLKKYQFYNIYR